MIRLELSKADAQALYDHTGTMPYLHRSWSNNVREALSEALANGERPREPVDTRREAASA
jgi:hypothetical protein